MKIKKNYIVTLILCIISVSAWSVFSIYADSSIKKNRMIGANNLQQEQVKEVVNSYISQYKTQLTEERVISEKTLNDVTDDILENLKGHTEFKESIRNDVIKELEELKIVEKEYYSLNNDVLDKMVENITRKVEENCRDTGDIYAIISDAVKTQLQEQLEDNVFVYEKAELEDKVYEDIEKTVNDIFEDYSVITEQEKQVIVELITRQIEDDVAESMPVKGTDYFTPEEIQNISDEVAGQIAGTLGVHTEENSRNIRELYTLYEDMESEKVDVEKYAAHMKENEEQYNTLYGSIRDINTEMDTFAKEEEIRQQDERISAMVSGIEENKEDINSRLLKCQVDMEVRDKELSDSILENRTELSDAILANRNELNSAILTNRAELNDVIETNKAELSDVIETNRALLDDKVETGKNELSNVIEANRTELDNSIKANKAELNNTIEANRTELNNIIEANKAELNTTIEENRATIYGVVENYKNELSNVIAAGKEELRNEIKNETDGIKSDLQATHKLAEQAYEKVEHGDVTDVKDKCTFTDGFDYSQLNVKVIDGFLRVYGYVNFNGNYFGETILALPSEYGYIVDNLTCRTVLTDDEDMWHQMVSTPLEYGRLYQDRYDDKQGITYAGVYINWCYPVNY